jgi:hypothetical protein
MAKGYHGESGSDKAFNAMDKAMKKSKGNEKTPATLLDSIKANFPDTWQYVLKEMYSEYKANKLENKP